MRQQVNQAENRAETITKKLKELKELLDLVTFPNLDEWGHELDAAIESMDIVSTNISMQHGEIDELINDR